MRGREMEPRETPEAARFCVRSWTGGWQVGLGSQEMAVRCLLGSVGEASGKVYLFCEATESQR